MFQELGVSDFVAYSKITDEELDESVQAFKSKHGITVGRSLVMGDLKSMGL